MMAGHGLGIGRSAIEVEPILKSLRNGVFKMRIAIALGIHQSTYHSLVWLGRGLVLAIFVAGLASCGRQDRPPSPREFKIQQSWQFQPGTEVAGHPIRGGLGDISIDINGGKIYAPMTGEVQPHNRDCVIFTSAELPAYLLRLCGVDHPKLGAVKQGEAIASSYVLSFAVLRKQPDGTWALVEPANPLLERVLTSSRS